MKNKVSGIYIIRNITTFDCYIGSSVNISRRWHVHRDTARRCIHHSRYFQRAWEKYGEDCFVFAVLEELPIDQLEYNEQNYLDLFRPAYNSSLKVKHQNFSKESTMSLSDHMTKVNKSRTGIKQAEGWVMSRMLSKMKLDLSQIDEIIKMHKDGISQIGLSKLFNVHKCTIARIVNNKIKILENRK